MAEVVLWDWHGVLGVQRYWQRPTRSLDVLDRLQAYVYSDGAPMLEWMRGEVSTRDLARACGVSVPDEVLVEQLYAGWPQLSFMNLPLLATVRQVWPKARHWMVTDNVDVFTPWLHTQPWFTEQFAGVTNSADHHVLKSDSNGLFGVALDAAGVDAVDAVFLDDSQQNCDAFQALGGCSIRVPTWSPSQ